MPKTPLQDRKDLLGFAIYGLLSSILTVANTAIENDPFIDDLIIHSIGHGEFS